MDVFVYGTLTEPARVGELLDSYAFVGAATLVGLRVVEGRYPTLAPPVDDGDDGDRVDRDDTARPEPGTADADRSARLPHRTAGVDGAVGGRLLRTDELAALDAYERVDDGLYTRVSVPLTGPDGDPEGEAAVYVGDPTRLRADTVWPGDEPFPERVRRAVAARDVRVVRQP